MLFRLDFFTCRIIVYIAISLITAFLVHRLTFRLVHFEISRHAPKQKTRDINEEEPDSFLPSLSIPTISDIKAFALIATMVKNPLQRRNRSSSSPGPLPDIPNLATLIRKIIFPAGTRPHSRLM
jgi:hypothetical protein